MSKLPCILLLYVLVCLYCPAAQTETPPSSLSAAKPPRTTATAQNLSPVTDIDALGRKIFIPVFRYKKKQTSQRIRVQNRT
uniref:Uncharacterized protein n=1 Tax=Anopheles minimus TaxID=112268 RepID=A0A182WAK6_9DIPT